MAWFKVDDKVHSHKKAARAGVAAMGLWTVAGSWCADHLTDGFVPDYIAERLAPGQADDLAVLLVHAGLWESDVHDGDDGWRFRDWCDYQPTRDDVEQKRERERDKKRQQRRDADGQYMSPRESPRDKAGTPQGSPEAVPPSRPDPSRTKDKNVPRKRATQLPDGWKPTPEPELVKAVGGDVAARRELEKFRDYWAAQGGAKGRKADWQATWRNWLRNSHDFRQRGSPEPAAKGSSPVFGSEDWDRRQQEQAEMERRLLGDPAS